MTTTTYPLRPFMPADTIALRELFAASIEELTHEEYDDDQRTAWASMATDGEAFAKRLGGMLTLVVMVDGEHAGFASLKDNTHIEMVYVHPWHAREGIGTALVDALERLAAARGTETLIVESSDTAQPFFESRGYVATLRNSIPVDDQWLTNMTMTKKLTQAAGGKQ